MNKSTLKFSSCRTPCITARYPGCQHLAVQSQKAQPYKNMYMSSPCMAHAHRSYWMHLSAGRMQQKILPIHHAQHATSPYTLGRVLCDCILLPLSMYYHFGQILRIHPHMPRLHTDTYLQVRFFPYRDVHSAWTRVALILVH